MFKQSNVSVLGLTYGETSGLLKSSTTGTTAAILFDAEKASREGANFLRLSGSGTFGGGEEGTQYTLYAELRMPGVAAATQVIIMLALDQTGPFQFTTDIPLWEDGTYVTTIQANKLGYGYSGLANFETVPGALYTIEFYYEFNTPQTDQDLRIFALEATAY